MVQVFDSRLVTREDRLDYWRELVSSHILLVDLDPRHDERPEAAILCKRIGGLQIHEVGGGGDHVYSRDERQVRRADPDSVHLGVPTRGSSLLTQDGREAILGPGDMVFWDSSRPYSLVMAEQFHWHVFQLPKEKLRQPDTEISSLTATTIATDSGIARVVIRHLLELSRHAEEIEEETSAETLAESALDLVAALVQSRFGSPWAVGHPTDVLRARVRAYLADHHADPDLDPVTIARAHSISVRTLHNLFAQEEASVMDRLRSIRLTAIRRELTDPRMAGEPIGVIARRHGLPNSTTFARAYRAEFGLSPSEFRAARLP
ncbi:helix-turn-helix domain-containing protein [Microbacterium sp. BR1]|uniref:AraC-like ligand-binding domain-containing protein n=1 Tax=Microbacterium sp. BR1 TaxID=1070896 RepID=UPI000C2C2BD8|nr:helix-turn-helix domain-containing protein [Microbacterium sp. BR1]